MWFSAKVYIFVKVDINALFLHFGSLFSVHSSLRLPTAATTVVLTYLCKTIWTVTFLEVVIIPSTTSTVHCSEVSRAPVYNQ